MLKPLSLTPLPTFEGFSSRSEPQAADKGSILLPTFESFASERAKRNALWPHVDVDSVVIQAVGEAASLDAKQVSTFLDEILDGMNAARANAAQRYPDNPDKASENLFEWACGVLGSKLERELDQSEQAHVREKCK